MTPAADALPRNRLSPTLWRTLWLTLVRYSQIDGPQWAASFAYYAIFALFPLLLLAVSIGAYFFDPAKVSKVVLNAVSQYVLVVHGKNDLVSSTVRGIVRARRGVGSFAILGLVWSSLRFFQSLVRGVNRAWGTHEYSWWRLPIQNLLMVAVLASALLLGIVTPPLLRWCQTVLMHLNLPFGAGPIVVVLGLVRVLVPLGVLFYGLSMFYKLAPRRRTTFREVWAGALAVTLVLRVLQYLFVLYAQNVAHFNAVYGAFGSVIAVLMWVYLTGTVIIIGGCFAAVQLELAGKLELSAPVPENVASP
ncbi:MAG: YihY/virulence factor BrkB family protein [Chthoniobacteraceae bacterium]|jgi:Ca2+-transporting ATPase